MSKPQMSAISSLFSPEAPEGNVIEAVCHRNGNASILLNAALRALDENADECSVCYEASELLRAYRDAVEGSQEILEEAAARQQVAELAG